MLAMENTVKSLSSVFSVANILCTLELYALAFNFIASGSHSQIRLSK
jgi:hypothetical protein